MIYLVKILSDTISYFFSVYLSMIFYSIPFSSALNEISYILIFGGYFLFILSIFNYKGYEHAVQFSGLRETTSLINAAILMLVVSILLLFIFQIDIPKFLSISSRFVFTISLILIPSTFRIIIKNLITFKFEQEPIVIIGLGEMGKSFLDIQSSLKPARYKILGIFDDNVKKGSKYKKQYEVLGGINDIDRYLQKHYVKRIIVAIRHLNDQRIIFLESKSNQYDLALNFLPSIESFQADPGKLKDHSGIPLVSKNINSQSLFFKIGKRFIDIIIALASFILLTPFWLIIPILIKKDSSGPVFFTQDRIGLNGNSFKLYKFRSMYIDTPKYAHCPTSADDPRITKVGLWLRKTSLDELPQLLNILLGNMSVVGPRPEMPFIVENYSFIEKKRLIVKPGLTGLWQISPHRNFEISHNLEYDFYYIENQGFVLDFVLLILTAFFVFRGITN